MIVVPQTYLNLLQLIYNSNYSQKAVESSPIIGVQSVQYSSLELWRPFPQYLMENWLSVSTTNNP